MRVRRLVAVVISAVLLGTGFAAFQVSTAPPPAAVAADGRDFKPGNIISDAVFYDSSAMTAAQVQSFLNARVPSCRAGYTCLKDFRQTTGSQPARSEGCAAYAGRSNETAATIISRVASACGINPQALIVLLEKEQSLITDTWPTDRQYRSATGYGCPDTADCDANYYGFFNQVYHAAWQFKKYRARPLDRGYIAGRNNTILWHPNTGCGSSTVFIENQATAGLYVYTPYRPNAAALNNLYGTGDGCSSYGNRNFWRIFTDWFGSTHANAPHEVFQARYAALGGTGGFLGRVTSGPKNYAAGVGQAFAGGSMYWSKSGGAREISGAIRDEYWRLGSVGGRLGFPTSYPISYTGGGRAQVFQKGSIYWSSATGARAVSGAIRDRYWAVGSINGSLGYPSSHLIHYSRGTGQAFAKGAIYALGTNAFETWGPVKDAFWRYGSVGGKLGYPTSGVISYASGGAGQAFEKGSVYAGPKLAGRMISGAIRDEYWRLGSVGGSLGYPTSEPIDYANGGKAQVFQRGSIYWSKTAGAHAVSGPIRDAYWKAGSWGALGFPTAAMQCNSGATSCRQDFERATISWTKAGGAVIGARESKSSTPTPTPEPLPTPTPTPIPTEPVPPQPTVPTEPTAPPTEPPVTETPAPGDEPAEPVPTEDANEIGSGGSLG